MSEFVYFLLCFVSVRIRILTKKRSDISVWKPGERKVNLHFSQQVMLLLSLKEHLRHWWILLVSLAAQNLLCNLFPLCTSFFTWIACETNWWVRKARAFHISWAINTKTSFINPFKTWLSILLLLWCHRLLFFFTYLLDRCMCSRALREAKVSRPARLL